MIFGKRKTKDQRKVLRDKKKMDRLVRKFKKQGVDKETAIKAAKANLG
tara:strand:- start:3640 stop:3783 length:144 start_codon:yes stop_codon:yes gene_type:complete